MQRILTADIGGTYSRFSGFTFSDDGAISRLNTISFITGSFSSFNDLIKGALLNPGMGNVSSWDTIVIAVPGLVREGVHGILPNVPWMADIRTLTAKMPNTAIYLINDFVAQGYACLMEKQLKQDVVQAGRAEDGGTIAVVGAGTGLGHCAIRKGAGDCICALPSEAGHAAFPFYKDDEIGFMEYLLKINGTSYPHNDLVVSGPGLSHLHAWLTGGTLPPEKVVSRIGPESETTEFFARFFARACRNYVLSTLSTSALYITGGVAMKNPFLVNNDYFREEFADVLHYRDMLETIPISLVRDEDIGLLGAALYGRVHLRV